MADIRELLNQLGIPNYTESLGAQLQNKGMSGEAIANEINNRQSLYKGLFESLVGRAPNETELRQIYGAVAPRDALASGNADQNTQLRNVASQYIGDTFQGAAKDYAHDQLVAQQGEANRLADMFRTQGRQAINDTEASLMDYQQRLFERLRPNLITSLQSQGLLNTGGLNQAVAGAQGDLATAAQGQLMDQRLQNEQQANAIAFGGASAPYEYQKNQIMNQLPYMQAQGQSALNQNFQTYMANLDYNNRMSLLRQSQGGGKGGFFQQMGNSLAPALGSQLGQNLGNLAIPNYTSSSANPQTGKSSSMSGVAALFA